MFLIRLNLHKTIHYDVLWAQSKKDCAAFIGKCNYNYIYNYVDKSNYFCYNGFVNFKERSVHILGKHKRIIPDSHPMTEFLRGKASKIFEDVEKNNTVVIVNKNSKPRNVIISYERYVELATKNLI